MDSQFVAFSSLSPQFAPAGGTSFVTLFVRGAMSCAMAILWLAGYAVAIARARHFLRTPRVGRAIEGVIGAVLVALGLRLATGHR